MWGWGQGAALHRYQHAPHITHELEGTVAFLEGGGGGGVIRGPAVARRGGGGGGGEWTGSTPFRITNFILREKNPE